jgi:LPS-assembly protein
MKKNILKKYLIFVFVFLLYSYCFSNDNNVEINADIINFFEKSGNIVANNNVILKLSDKKIYSDLINYNTNTNILNASGNIKIENNNYSIYANNLLYNDNDKTYIADGILCCFRNIYMSFNNVKIINNKYLINGIKISNCNNFNKPHTYFKSKYGKLILNKRITTYNNVFYIGKIPIFYFPVITKSLKTDKSFGSDLKFKFKIGHMKLYGHSIEKSVSFALDKNSTIKLEHDSFSRNNDGYGFNLDYIFGKVSASIYSYRTKSMYTDNGLKIAKSKFLYSLNDSLYMKSKIEKIIVDNYENSYPLLEKKQLDKKDRIQSSLSIVSFKKNFNFFIDISKYNMIYDRSYLFIPSVKLNVYDNDLFKKKIISKLFFQYFYKYNSFDNFLKNNFKSNIIDDNYNVFLLKHTLQKPFKINKKIIISPNLNIVEKYLKRKKTNYFHNVVESSVNTRLKIAKWINFDFVINKNIHRNCNFCLNDTNDMYNCFECNNFMFVNRMYIGDRITIDNMFLHNFYNNNINILNEKIHNKAFATDFSFISKKSMLIYMKYSKFMKFNELESSQFYIKTPEYKNIDLLLGVFNNKTINQCNIEKKDDINNVFGIGIKIINNFKFNYKLFTSFDTNFKNIKIREQEFEFIKNLHCYDFKFVLRKKNLNNSSFFFKINMNILPSSNKTKYIKCC